MLRRYLAHFTLLILLLAAFLLRFDRATNVPSSPYFDESALAVNSLLIAEGGVDQYGRTWPLFFRALDDYKDPVFIYSYAALLKVLPFGVDSLRLTAVLWGTLGILAQFLFLRSLLRSSRWALLGTTLLALTPWHFQFSRIAWQAISLVTLYTFFLWAIFEFRKRLDLRWGILSAIFLASCWYAYSPAKLLVVVSLALYPWNAFFKNKKVFAVTAFVFTILSLPFVVYFLQHSSAINHRLTLTLLDRRLWDDAYFSAFSYDFLFGVGDHNLRHSNGEGSFLWPTLPLLLAGLWAWICERRLLLLFFFFFMPALGAFTGDYPHATRIITWIPFLILVMTVGAKFLFERFSRYRNIFVSVFLMALVLSFADYRFRYFRYYPEKSVVEWQAGSREVLAFAVENGLVDEVQKHGETFNLVGLHYSQFLFVKPMSAQFIIENKSKYDINDGIYDPFDYADKYAPTLGIRSWIGRMPKTEDIGPGLWAVEKRLVAELFGTRSTSILFESGAYALVRVGK